MGRKKEPWEYYFYISSLDALFPGQGLDTIRYGVFSMNGKRADREQYKTEFCACRAAERLYNDIDKILLEESIDTK